MEKLEEVIYMAQPKGYEVKGKEDMVLSSSQVYLWIEVISKTMVYQVWYFHSKASVSHEFI